MLWLGIRVAVFGTAALAGFSSGLTVAAEESNVADCRQTMIGHGRADWRGTSVVAGPVGVARNPLSAMSRTRNGQLVAKMPILVAGHSPVVVSVPPRLRHRVFLYYGRMLDREGHPTTSFTQARGYGETEFEPCIDRPRTIWPGGIRIKGRSAVHLIVAPEGAGPVPLRLGRPRVYGSG